MSLTSVMSVPGSRRKTPLRTSQIEDEIWLPALRIAAIRKESLSAVMRDAVKRYVARHKHLLDEQGGADHKAQ
jgi:hypothetical protein